MYTKEFIETILKYSSDNQVSEKKAAEHFKLSYKTLPYYKRKYGIEMNPIGNGKFTYRYERQHNVNDNFFEIPNIMNCYWAGFIAADGCIHKRSKQCKLSIGLSSKDKQHLETFKNNINFSGPILESSIIRNDKIFYSSTINITSQKISDDLYKNFNITPKKSLTLLPPNITDERLIDAFICGYIDGDGSISLYKNHIRNIQDSLSISMLGTYEMITWIKNRFTNILGKECGCISKKNKDNDKNTYSYTVGNSKNVREIFKHFYHIDVPKLERKWKPEIYEYCINYKKKEPICKRKGVNVFDLDGNFIKHFDRLSEASEYTGVSIGRISDMCKMNDSEHMAKGYMFSRDETMKKYEPSKFINTKYL